MAEWKSRVKRHARVNGYFFQVNVPRHDWLDEFELVMFKNGAVLERATFWRDYDDEDTAMMQMVRNRDASEHCADYIDEREPH